MNPSKVEEGPFHHSLDAIADSQPLILDHHHQEEEPPPPMEFCLPPLSEFDLFRDDDDEDSVSRTSSDADGLPPATNNTDVSSQKTNPRLHYVNPEPHISSQFYTFNMESHSLMIRCILDCRLANPDKIRAATPQAVLASWRSVWKDRNEDTAYLTAWKRIQDKLTVHRGQHGNEFLCFKNNSNNQFVSYTTQWQDIVMSFHGDADLKHLGLKETIERIKQVWTVGAKFYGIPESYIRACVAACPVCLDLNGSGGGRSKRRRFEYTESFDVPAKEVPNKLQQLAAKHKVVLCIRQKYIRYKPFMAEVKDYACHRAGEPTSSSKKSRILKREPYASKRCRCGFRIRAIVPISNYNEKDKTFVYQEEGTAVFKLFAIHSGHEPGPLDGNARIMHRIVGHRGGVLMDQDLVYGMSEETDNENFMGKDDGDMQHLVFQQVKELKNEVGLLEGKIAKITKIQPELLSSVSQEMFDLVNKVRSVREYGSKSSGLLLENDLVDWSGHQRIYGDGKDTNLIEDDEDSFERTLGDVGSWDQISGDCRNEKDLVDDSCKPEKWLKSNGYDEKGILDCEDSKLSKPVRHDEPETDSLVGLHVENFYPENPKWYDSP
ncbi:hypothetical protein Ccrd_000777 [Cynara cardunculus var. scolymus]|uniref:Uncharacterized protein n=1 Tax=Cynara cardunculus var. scolymus TaxID=59895 RepID=A0A118JXH1_CYNCS|nr:hypothetical protein Ccrd_000777 [Cynara cardunculus var. scolymus]